jgi:hypothetical protein
MLRSENTERLLIVTKPARPSYRRNADQHRYDEALRENPPILIWITVPNTGGLRVGRVVSDPDPEIGHRRRTPLPPCACNLYGSPRRQAGPHHEDECDRSEGGAA